MKSNHKTESPEEFLVKLRNLALKAYSTPIDQPVAPVDGGVQGDQDRFDREKRENENRRNFAQMERKRHIIRLFKKAMPKFIRLKLLEEPETATIQELCTKARKNLILRELCPANDWSRDGFNEISTDESEKLLTVLTTLTEAQSSLEKRFNASTEKVSQPQQANARQHFNNHQNWRRNSRGRFNQNRGNRGYNNNHRSNNFQNQYQGRYGKNFRRNSRGRISYRRNNYRENNRGNYSNNDNRNSNFQQYDNQNVEVTLDTRNAGGHIETTAFSQKVCYSCGYPNHTAKNCEMRGRSKSRGGQIPFNSQSKN